MKIVVLDGHCLNPGDISWEPFSSQGEFACRDRTPPDRVIEAIGDADAVVTNKTPVTRRTLEACPNIRYVGVLATGYNNVDAAAARERGIPVTNVPSYGTMAVAQFAFALILEACHHVGRHSDGVMAGRWSKSPDYCYWDYPLIELDGKTLGVVGYGRIGRAVARIADALGMRVLAAASRPRSGTDELGTVFVGREELFARADIVSLHAPLNADTEGMIDRRALSAMRPGVIVVNTARGALVVEADMRAALDAGKVFCYAADVVSEEPIRPDNPLLGAPNCLLTPHIAWAPRAARMRLLRTAAENLAAFAEGRPVNVVNA